MACQTLVSTYGLPITPVLLQQHIPFGLSIAISSSLRTFLCDNSFKSLISRMAVTGNWEHRSDLGFWTVIIMIAAYPVFLIMH